MKRFIAVLLSILLLAGSVGVTALAAGSLSDSGIDYTESLETIANPGVGAASNSWKTLGQDDLPDSFSVPAIAPCFDIGGYSSGNDYTQSGYPSVSVDTPTRVGGENTLIDDAALADLDGYFAAAEKQGTIVIPRFAYTWSDSVGAEPDDISWMVAHIEQLSAVINRYPGTVVAVEAGMIGPWGEMHSSKYSSREDMNTMLGAWVENLDEDISILCRTSNYFINYICADNEGTQAERNALFMQALADGNALAHRFGMYNDGYLGNAWDYGTWGSNTMSRAEGIEMLKILGEDAPYGGEMAYCGLDHVQGTVTGGSPSPIYSDTFVKELYDTHLSYLANITSSTHTIKLELDEITFGENHYFDGMPDVSAYYGQSMQKFMLDHMGYRFVVREAKNDASVYTGSTVHFEGLVENVGFGNVLFGTVAELIIENSEGAVQVVALDLDPAQWKSTETTAYSIDAAIPADMAAGEYKAYLRFGNAGYESAAQGAYSIRFANDGIWNDTYGANYIGSFTLATLQGDANCDGELNVLDLQCIARYIAQGGAQGQYDLTSCNFDAMDADTDGKIGQVDLNVISKLVTAQ